MAAGLNPYIGFDGNAREAMEFYREVFGGELELSTVGDIEGPDAPGADAILHAQLTTPEGHIVMAWDVPDGVPHRPGNDVAIHLGGDDSSLRDRFERLSVGGTVTMPLEKQAWGDEAGSLVDRFGISWMVNISAQV